jgi:predicted outer membrane repeat protein
MGTCMFKPTFALGIGLLILAFFAPAAFGNNIGVTNTNDSGPGSLRSAIASAASGDTIYFNPKAIRFPATITLASRLTIIQNVTITGPGASWVLLDGRRSVQVLQINAGATVSISGVTIQNGLDAGILNFGSTTLDSIKVSENLGIGVFNQGVLTVSRSTVSNNVGGSEGAGIANYGGTLLLTDSTLAGNTAERGGGLWNVSYVITTPGGGLAQVPSLVTIHNSVISGNTVGFLGGGIYNLGPADRTHPGAIITISNSVVSGNSSNYAGGGVYNDGFLIATNVTFSGNSAGSRGGGIMSDFTVYATNTTISGNSAPSGGGLYVTPIVINISLKNTILANNPVGGNCDTFFALSQGHNLSDDTSCMYYLNQPGDMNSTSGGLDPAGLKNNGGPTPTFALLPASPAVDAVPLSSCSDVEGNTVTTDQRGIARPQGPACDIGAFELVPQGAGIPLTLLK